ncbi:MAG: type I-C CRISPR-associated protein Cas8c/Csd1 [Planctomycetes bacterium]|nr:type I-C CRISPR-associated protein Cas8c/Csd1 [Planctomycetota bacterium]
MIPALVRLYDRLAAEGEDAVAPEGYSSQKVGFCVVLNKNGTLSAAGITREFVTLRREVTKKVKGQPTVTIKEEEHPKQLILPGQSKPSGSGLNPCFLWDNSAYLLGFKPEDPKPERTKKAFEAFRDRHLALRKEIDDEGFDAVCKFLEAWKPSDAKAIKDLADTATNFGVFRLRLDDGYVHEREAVRAWWEANGRLWAGGEDAETEESPGELKGAPSLVDGVTRPIALTHKPAIKGVAGSQAMGAMLVSFNQTSFNSFGKEQGENAPIGVDDVFKYCTALTRITTDPKRRVRLAGDTIVFWAEKPSPAELVLAATLDTNAAGAVPRDTEGEGLGISLLGGSPDPDEEARAIYEKVRRGEPVTLLPGKEVPFYILGLSPNVSRLSVRLWEASSVGAIVERLRTYHAELAMHPEPPDSPPLSVRRLVAETTMPKGGFADESRVNPTLAAEVTRSILTGAPYPRALLAGVVARCRIEGLADSQTRNDFRQAQHRRCAVIRACLTRSHPDLEVPVSLDENSQSTPYNLGRLFAVLERIQENALGNINTTIKDRYFGAASCTPATVFPRLLRLTQHHVNKIENPGQRTVREKELGAVVGRLESFPRTLSLEAQGLFAIGYYHQRQSYFQVREKAAEGN